MEKQSLIYVAGHTGLVGSYLVQELYSEGYNNVITKKSSELNLTKTEEVESFFAAFRPEYVFLVAAVKGGVAEYAKKPVEFFDLNMRIESNVLSSAKRHGVKKLVFVGASCVYPESEGKVISEDFFQSGWVQKATEPYALAKAAGYRLCEYYNSEYNTRFVTALLVNIFGMSDRRHFDTTSVIPSLLERFLKAVKEGSKEIVIWGDGKTKREFLHAKDCASALLRIMESNISAGGLNVGSGEMITINDLAETIAEVVGYQGKIIHDLSKPNGSQRSVLDVSKLKELGWSPQISLKEGLREMVYNLRK